MKRQTEAKARISTPATVNVRFEFTSAAAGKVCLAGSFNDWSVETTTMDRLGNGQWVKCLPLRPGRYEYRFVLDGKWGDDPQASGFVPNPHGGVNAVVRVALRT
jgi:1,4-alpha-glucan branching enzyme